MTNQDLLIKVQDQTIIAQSEMIDVLRNQIKALIRIREIQEQIINNLEKELKIIRTVN